MVVMAIGCLILAFMAIQNFRRTNLVYGVFGTAVQLSIFTPVMVFGFTTLAALGALWFVLTVLGGLGTLTVVRVI